MSQFFESEVIVCEYDSDSEDWGEEHTFLEYVESKKDIYESIHADIGDSSDSELYIYFNADMEFSMWQLCPHINSDYVDIFRKTFEKEYIFLDLDFEKNRLYRSKW